MKKKQHQNFDLETHIINLLDNLKGKLGYPQVLKDNLIQQRMWLAGRNSAVRKVRHHLRKNISNPLPYIKESPSRFFNSEEGRLWLEGYHAVLRYVDEDVNRLIQRIIA